MKVADLTDRRRFRASGGGAASLRESSETAPADQFFFVNLSILAGVTSWKGI
jgi:hypothetical protein